MSKNIEDANIEVIINNAADKIVNAEFSKKTAIQEAAKEMEKFIPKQQISSELSNGLKAKHIKISESYVREVLGEEYKDPEKRRVLIRADGSANDYNKELVQDSFIEKERYDLDAELEKIGKVALDTLKNAPELLTGENLQKVNNTVDLVSSNDQRVNTLIEEKNRLEKELEKYRVQKGSSENNNTVTITLTNDLATWLSRVLTDIKLVFSNEILPGDQIKAKAILDLMGNFKGDLPTQ